MSTFLDPAYRHRPKRVHIGPALTAGPTRLKWFDLDEPEFPVAPATRKAAQAFCTATLRDPDDRAGFAILHRCGENFHFLLTCLWRGNNELWQAVDYIDANIPEFTAFAPAYPGLGTPRPTFCVWEMGIVAAEALTWQTYLSSPRSPADLDRWLHDAAQGQV